MTSSKMAAEEAGRAMMIVAEASGDDIFDFFEMWVGVLVILLVVRTWFLLRRYRGKPFGRGTAVCVVVVYGAIAATLVVLVVKGYAWVLFVLFFLAPDLPLVLLAPVKKQEDIAVTEDKCDLCLNNLYAAGKPHAVGSHMVCGKCHETIEEAKNEEGVF